MVSINRHSVISEDHQGRFVINFVNNILDNPFTIEYLPFNLWMLAHMSVPSTIKADNMSHHNGEITPSIKFFIDSSLGRIIVRVQVANI